MGYAVESNFEHEGLKCVVIFTTQGHRCGYVGVKAGHPLYGKDYHNDNIDFDVHGGITYSGGSGDYPIDSPCVWWFGFDCIHLDDGKDMPRLHQLFPKEYKFHEDMERRFPTGGRARSQTYVENECKLLAKQISEHSSKSCYES